MGEPLRRTASWGRDARSCGGSRRRRRTKSMNSRILLIEDEPGLVLTLSDLLAAEGHTVESATDGVTGLAKAASEPFDAIILDVMLPGKNGLDVCREIRQRGSDVAILMLTGKTQINDRLGGLKLGADRQLNEPVSPSE